MMPMIPALYRFNVWWRSARSRRKLLGFPHYAAWKIADRWQKTQKQPLNFMREIVPAARQHASDELASIQAVIDKQQGGFSAQPWTGHFMPSR